MALISVYFICSRRQKEGQNVNHIPQRQRKKSINKVIFFSNTTHLFISDNSVICLNYYCYYYYRTCEATLNYNYYYYLICGDIFSYFQISYYVVLNFKSTLEN